MRIVSNVRIRSADAELVRPAHLIEINCADADDESLINFLIWQEIDLLVVDRLPPAAQIARWRKARNRSVIILMAQTDVASSKLEHVDDYCSSAIIVRFDHEKTSLEHALGAAEHIFTSNLNASQGANLLPYRPSSNREKVLVVGAGIVSLVTALYLNESGYLVEVVEQSEDPRHAAGWSSLGCTHGGENARMFSLTECDNYHDQDMPADGILNAQIYAKVSDRGWFICQPEHYDADAAAWMSSFAQMPIWLARRYNEDIFALSHDSYSHWKQLRQKHPKLFQNVELRDGLVRIARTESYHTKQVKRQKHVRSFQAELSREELSASYPALSAGCDNAEIIGGIEVEGFTLNIHTFCHNLIEYLVDRGVVFRWETKADTPISVGDATVGIRIDGKLEKADHYFISPGVYGPQMLKGAQSEGQVHGMLGAWISIPNLEPKLQKSLKVSREGHIANSGNIIVAKDKSGEDILIFGSGFGYVGAHPDRIDQAQLECLFRSMEDYLSQLFPRAYERAMDTGMLRASRRYCVRPWTPSCLGIFEIKEATTGRLVIATGHNTGGFAQSPSIAAATLAAFQGQSHRMHQDYHPRRYSAFWTEQQVSVAGRLVG
jgi:glycine/D-amino acid oxidase-like deaminating enzyme